MANVAVRFYGDFPEADRRGPDDWPAWVREIGDNISYSEGSYSWTVMSREAYDLYWEEHYDDYLDWVATQPPDYAKLVLEAMENAQSFGQWLIKEFYVNNVVSGISCEGIAYLIQKLDPLFVMLQTGSLETALYTIQQMEPDEYLPQSTIDCFSSKIAEYLGVSL